jgi:hypothetical protein
MELIKLFVVLFPLTTKVWAPLVKAIGYMRGYMKHIHCGNLDLSLIFLINLIMYILIRYFFLLHAGLQ